MSSDPISPELVLVSPELREQALASLRVERAEPATVPLSAAAAPAQAGSLRAAASILGGLARFSLLVVLAVVTLTLVLTLAANATR
jgi:hypothetical protein